ncbi:uncharacterized protein LOC119673426 [Teleopsis dalmanni]|uniref:uncharacterized protein LOC119673426 n=1 Tax=Teleopsis dalmanni TaxID=139649 RepID=UPI0018CF2A21|nr:uncharacterized protein LOC119673426 [Teleopsis dalmanni]
MVFVNEEFWKEFIGIYESLLSLWKIKDNDYHNRSLKAESYKVLVEKLKEIYPDANIEMVKKKINTLRSGYRRELKKIVQSERSGAGVSDVYTSSLWHFDDLGFLKDQESEITGVTSMEEPLNGSVIEEQPAHKRRIRTDSERTTLLNDAIESLKTSQQQDDATNLSIGWATQFRKLNSNQQIYANKMINEVLYQATLENLDLYSYKVVEGISARGTTHHLSQSFSPNYASSSSNGPSPPFFYNSQSHASTSNIYIPAISPVHPLPYVGVEEQQQYGSIEDIVIDEEFS